MPGLILMAMGLLLGAISGAFRKVPNRTAVVGEIVSLEQEKYTHADRTKYWAIVEYCVDGTFYTVKSTSKSTNFQTGQKVRVAYNQACPQQAVVRPGILTYIVVAGFVIAGMAVFCITVFR